jgi:AmmeMemoRadiSam system protein B
VAQLHPVCYPSDPKEAEAFFREAMTLHPLDEMPAQPKGTRVAGIVTPHLDFRACLPAYSAAFQPLLAEPAAETYIILGVGHKSRREWNLDRRGYETPLGHAECAGELVDALAAGIPEARVFSPAAHVGEHSIEFALVWLQAVERIRAQGPGKPVRFVPLLCGGMHGYIEGMVEWDGMGEFHRLAENLGRVLREAGDRVKVIVSIDGCHMGTRFDDPFRMNPAMLKATAGWEHLLWTQVARGDARAFLDWFREQGNDRYFDGVGALALLLHAARGEWAVQRTDYGQYFTEQDGSVVTYSSGRVLAGE